MNPPSDPFQLLVYGIGTVLVVGALKLWDRRGARRLQNTADKAAAQATLAAKHAGDAKDAARTVQAEGATAQGVARAATSEQVAEVGRGVEASLILLAERIGEVSGRMSALERAVDVSIATERVRRSRDRQPQ